MNIWNNYDFYIIKIYIDVSEPLAYTETFFTATCVSVSVEFEKYQFFCYVVQLANDMQILGF